MRELNQEYLTFEDGGWWSATTDEEDYWGELPQSEFRLLLEKVKREKDFDLAILDYFRANSRMDLYPYITDTFGRSSWHELITAQPGDVAVDLGAGLGAISEFLANRYARVYSIEGCRDRCEFLSLRKTKKSLDNVTIIRGGVHQLPLRDSSVDLVVCNGVLEWVGLGRAGEVRQIQVDFLREAVRVLKKEGILYIGIENRFALPYFLGAPDHSGVRFTSLVPRTVASLMVRAFSGVRNFSVSSLSDSYRTYTYTKRGYDALLAEAGFAYRAFYHVEPSYDLPSIAYPVADGDKDLKRFYKMFGPQYIPLSVQRILCSNFFVFASKEELIERLSDKPIYFGYFDRCTLAGETIQRRDKQGGTRNEPLVNGVKLLDLPRYERKRIRTSDIIRCYENCCFCTPSRDAFSGHGSIAQIMETVLGPHLTTESIQKMGEQIIRSHQNRPNHGDFWLGNILKDRESQSLSVIDSESQLFGSPELDVVDFAIEYIVNARERQGFRIDLHALYEYFGIREELNDLITIALARQVLRYSPVHRSNILVYRYLELLKNYLTSGRLVDSGSHSW